MKRTITFDHNFTSTAGSSCSKNVFLAFEPKKCVVKLVCVSGGTGIVENLLIRCSEITNDYLCFINIAGGLFITSAIEHEIRQPIPDTITFNFSTRNGTQVESAKSLDNYFGITLEFSD